MENEWAELIIAVFGLIVALVMMTVMDYNDSKAAEKGLPESKRRF